MAVAFWVAHEMLHSSRQRKLPAVSRPKHAIVRGQREKSEEEKKKKKRKRGEGDMYVCMGRYMKRHSEITRKIDTSKGILTVEQRQEAKW